MIKKAVAKEVLDNCLKTGGDFAELFIENTVRNDMEFSSGEVRNTNTSNIYGAGIRILNESQEVYGYTNDLSCESLLKLSALLAGSYNGEKRNIKFKLKAEKIENRHKAALKAANVSNEDKVAIMKKAYEAAKGTDTAVSQVIVSLFDDAQDVEIVNSDGKIVYDTRNHIRLAVRVIASSNGVMQVSTDSIGGNCGYELLKNADIENFARGIAHSAVTMLGAEEMTGQMMPVVIHNAFGGVILHEACGHSLEATSVAKGLSVFCGKLGQKIASDIVTAVDDGTIVNAWGSLNVDDEGTKTRRNVLIENGVLKSYLVDKRNARIMKCDITASSRRQSYRFSPTSRMTNTFFVNGNSSFEDIIANTKYGFFAKKMGGGSVNPVTGEFNFAVNEGYMIEDGKITRPVRGATLIGNGADVLKRIDMIGNNLSFGHGVCGSASGSIPANVGQPTIRLTNMTVGGRGGKK